MLPLLAGAVIGDFIGNSIKKGSLSEGANETGKDIKKGYNTVKDKAVSIFS